MLKLNKKIKLSNISGPVNFRFQVPACMSYDVLSFDNNTIDVDFIYKDQACVNDATVILIIQQPDCPSREIEIDLEDPCDSLAFTATPVEHIYGLKFRANVELSKFMPYEYTWDADTDALKVKSVQGNEVEFEVVKNITNGPIDIHVKVKNKNGCCITGTLNHDLCLPFAQSNYVVTQCANGEIVAVHKVIVETCDGGPGCAETNVVDWGTLKVETPLRVTWTHLGNGFIRFNFPSDFPETQVVVNFCVKDTIGLEACGEICIDVRNCDNGKFFLRSGEAQIGCQDCIQEQLLFVPEGTQICKNAPVAVQVENLLNSPEAPNWGSFEFIPGIGDTIVSPTEIVTPNGSWKFGLDHKIVFTPTAQSPIESVKYKIADQKGRIASGFVDVFSEPECLENNSAVTTFDDTVCVVAGKTVRFNPLLNDNGLFDPATLSVDFPPAEVGELVLEGNGQIAFTANPSYTGTYDLNYYVNDVNGVQSNTSVIHLSIMASPEEPEVKHSVCKTQAFEINPFDLISSGNTTYNWRYEGGSAKFGVNGVYRNYGYHEQIGNNHTPIIDLSNSVPGDYIFSYGENLGSCSNRIYLLIEVVETINIGPNVSLDVCANNLPIQLSSIKELTGGQWQNVIPGNLNDNTFDPSVGVGTYLYRYTIPNEGDHNSVCDSIFDVEFNVVAEVNVGQSNCAKVCSVYPTDIGPEECIDPGKIVYSPSCNTCLFDLLLSDGDEEKTIGGKWKLASAPRQVGNLIFINGVHKFINVGTYIPGSYDGCIDLGASVPGEYVFVYEVGVKDTACYDEQQIKITVVPAPELADNIEITICDSHGEDYLWHLMLKYWQENKLEPLDLCQGDFALVSGDPDIFVLDGCESKIDTRKKVFEEDEEFILSFTYGIDVDNDCDDEECPECQTCKKTIQVTINVDKDTAAGTANNLTVCEGSCPVNLGARLENSVAGGKWTYIGCNLSANTAIDEDCDSTIGGHSIGETLGGNIINPVGSPGFYWFEYKVQRGRCCSTTRLILQIIETDHAGNDGSCILCTDPDVCVTLFDVLQGTPTPGGVWHNASLAPNALNTCTGTGDDFDTCGEILQTGDPGIHLATGTFNSTDLLGTFIFYYVVPIQTPEYELVLNGDCCGAARVTIIVQQSGAANLVNSEFGNGPGALKELYEIQSSPMPGGIWYYLGEGDSNGPSGSPVQNILVGSTTYAPGSQLGTSDHVLVNFEGQAEGHYWFRYINGAGDCAASDDAYIQITNG